MAAVTVEFATKILVPQRSGDVIRRQRLLDLLHNGIVLRTQVVSAPAGYGKTTMLADFAGDVNAPVCWYSLDTSDQDPWQLLEGLLSSIRFRFPDFGRITESRLSGAQDVSGEAQHIVRALTGEMYTAVAEYFVLVLEDYHFVQESNATRETLNLLVQHIPENAHLILSSRTAVDLPAVSSLVVRRQAASYGASELSFTPTETKDLVAACQGLYLSDVEASRLAADTEGWAIGILVSSRRADEDSGRQGVSVLNREDVVRYLESEVFDRQPAEIRNFLLVSSTLSSIEPEVCERLLGMADSRALLHRIERQNLFTQRVDPKKGWYRYHHLFREFLQDKLLLEDPERFRCLHSAAARLLEEGHRWNEAIAHFLSASRYDEALRIVKAVGEEFQSAGKWSTVSKWIEAFPADIRMSDPDLVLLHAQSLVYLGETDEAARLLTRLLSQVASDDEWLYRAKALSWRSAAFRLTGHFAEARSDIKVAIRLLEERDGPAAILGDAYRRLGNVHAEQGCTRTALKYMHCALEQFSSIFDVGHIADVNNMMGWLYERLGDLDQASMHLEHAREGWQKTGNSGALAMTLNNIAHLYHRRGQHELALDTLRLGLEKVREVGYRRIEACLLIAVGEVLRDSGVYDEALHSYHEGLELARQVMEPYYVAWAKAGLGETYRLVGDSDRAEALTKEAISQAEAQGQTDEATIFAMQLGIIEYERQRYEAATEILSGVADRLDKKGDKDALAKAYFHLAQVSFLAREYDQALGWITKTSDLADELGYDGFLAVEGRDAVPLIQYGASREIGGERFTRTMQRIEEQRERRRRRADASVPVNPRASATTDLEVYAFGETRVEGFRTVNDGDWKSSTAKEMFFYMLCNPAGQAREQITAVLWPDLPPAKATSNFHISLYRIRRAIFPGILTFKHGQYRLGGGLNTRFDVIEFECLLNRAESVLQDDETRIKTLERAVELYKGPFMPGHYSEWVETRRRDLEDKLLKGLWLLATLRAGWLEYTEAIAHLERLLTIDPYQDEAYSQLVEYHLAMGNRISASRTYKRYVDTVASELGLSPSPRMYDLHERMMTDYKQG